MGEVHPVGIYRFFEEIVSRMGKSKTVGKHLHLIYLFFSFFQLLFFFFIFRSLTEFDVHEIIYTLENPKKSFILFNFQNSFFINIV